MNPIIKLQDVEVTFTVGGKPLRTLSIPEWTVGHGEQAALVGPSGCGKTTLLHVLSGLLSPNRGTVEVCCHRLEQMRESELDQFRGRNIGYIFQSFNLLQGYTALENVLLGLTFSGNGAERDKAVAVLDRVGLESRMHHHPAQLSIGEQQRVAVARAIAKKPRLILADEPTGSLDPANTQAVADLIQKVCAEEDCALVLVSHAQEVVARFGNVVSFLGLNRAGGVELNT